MDWSLNTRVSILFAGAAIGFFVGNLLTPVHVYFDPPLGLALEVARYRAAYLALAIASVTAICTLATARMVGFGIVATVLASTISGAIYNIFLVIVQHGGPFGVQFDSLITVIAYYLPAYLFATFAVTGFWYTSCALLGSEDNQ